VKVTATGLVRVAAIGVTVLSASTQGPTASAQTADPEIAKLREEVRKRDALIDNLLRRVENLEQRTNAANSAPASSLASARPSRSQSAATRDVVALQPTGNPPAPPSPATSVPATGPSPEVAQAAPQSPQPPPASPAPGQFDVSPEAAERALERTLTATGALLVPQGYAEVEPAAQYRRSEFTNLVILGNNRNEYTGSVATRLGLPFESQLDLGVPYVAAQSETVNNFVAPQQQVSHATGRSFGDVTVGLSKTLLHEQGWLPDLIGRVGYEIPTGPVFSNSVALTGSGQNRLSFTLTALKRQDPLAFVASVGYSQAFTYSHINPGNQVNLTGGVFLATSPETTLRTVLQQSFSESPTVNGVKATAGNLVQSILTFGASSTLGRGLLLDLQAGIGLTNSSPKYFVIVSLPWRFSVPGL
jgi:hypothetical protein